MKKITRCSKHPEYTGERTGRSNCVSCAELYAARHKGNPKCPKCGKIMIRGPKAASGKTRWSCRSRVGGSSRGYCYTTTDPSPKVAVKANGEEEGTAKNPQFKRGLSGVTRFVITAAQNATPVHEGFLRALKGYCKHNNAELIVIPIRYKNPSSVWTSSQKNEEIWDPQVVPYLYNQRKKLNPNLVLLGDIKTIATAVSPLTGFEGITHGESGILGHTKLQLKTVPTQSKFPKVLTTTGAVTIANYTDSKTGKIGEFHHSLAACAVDIHGRTFHMRQLRASSDGSFIDYDKEYLPTGAWEEAGQAKALILGDFHYRTVDPQCLKATFGPGGMVEVLDPEVVVFHDLLDGMSRNPHHRGNPFAEMAKRQWDFHLVEKEVRETIKGVAKLLKGRKGIIVPSNHDRFLARWVTDSDWRQDPDNAAFYLETARAMVDSTKMTPQGHSTVDPFMYWVDKLAPKNLRALRINESLKIAGIECNMHGDMGPNGARGSVKNLSRIGVKVVSGHGHSPAIEEGHDRVGTMSYLRLEYNLGPSSWLNTNGAIHSNGKQSLYNMINGAWRL